MNEKFTLFLNEVPPNLQEFVLELDDYLLGKECKRKIEPAKNGYVTTYASGLREIIIELCF